MWGDRSKTSVTPSISRPTIALRDAFLRMLDDYDVHDPKTGERYRHVRQDFAAYVQGLHDDEDGLVGIVPIRTVGWSTKRRRPSSRSSGCVITSTRTYSPMSLVISATMSHPLSGVVATGWLLCAPD
jgi:hypothetical protein